MSDERSNFFERQLSDVIAEKPSSLLNETFVRHGGKIGGTLIGLLVLTLGSYVYSKYRNEKNAQAQTRFQDWMNIWENEPEKRKELLPSLNAFFDANPQVYKDYRGVFVEGLLSLNMVPEAKRAYGNWQDTEAKHEELDFLKEFVNGGWEIESSTDVRALEPVLQESLQLHKRLQNSSYITLAGDGPKRRTLSDYVFVFNLLRQATLAEMLSNVEIEIAAWQNIALLARIPIETEGFKNQHLEKAPIPLQFLLTHHHKGQLNLGNYMAHRLTKLSKKVNRSLIPVNY